ncbi:MAG: transglutaminase domain-containing protein [FCB group bacterium]|nr:transglutaminase domain-containing protein [FCB group bacterium]
MMKSKLYLLLPVVFLAVSCTCFTITDTIAENYEKAGSNRQELRKALIYFSHKGDSLQLAALNFLIRNMDEHSYVEFGIFDSNDVEIQFDVLDYTDYDAMVAAMDTMEVEYGELHYARKTLSPDLTTITADLLIENIELAFQVWQEKSWAQKLSFETFCELILPYRGSNEPVEKFRQWFLDRYRDIPLNGNKADDPIAAAEYINDDLKQWFKFDPRYYRHPTDQGLDEMRTTGRGRCEDMTNLAIYAMRANGLPVTSDYTPYWANIGNNHAWNAILSPEGKAVPFMGCEANPGHYVLFGKLAKAYRKTYSRQTDNLASRLLEWESAPRWLSGSYYADVTGEYTETADVTLNLSRQIPDSTRFAYLCVFNSGEWQAIHWGKLEGSAVTFTDMGTGIAYLPMFYVHEELLPADAPFILTTEGQIIPLDGSSSAPVDLQLISTTRVKFEAATEARDIVALNEGKTYILKYWNDGWTDVGEQQAGSDPLIFKEVPGDRLYWLVEKDSRREERIFTWENGRQVWW